MKSNVSPLQLVVSLVGVVAFFIPIISIKVFPDAGITAALFDGEKIFIFYVVLFSVMFWFDLKYSKKKSKNENG